VSASHLSTVNHWPDSACARAFWGQHELTAYQELLADTAAWLDPQPGERWLDLGCGSGQLTRALWHRSCGTLAEIVSLDCAAVNAKALRKVCAQLRPAPGDRVRFVPADFSKGLAWPDETFDGIVSGLALQYAESFSVEQGRWTTAAYDRLLGEIHRVLRPGGRLVFSVNVPDPSWLHVGLASLGGVWRSPRPLRLLRDLWRMGRYGRWLKREARRGRFHYLPLPVVLHKLTVAGFDALQHRLSYAGQAYLIRCQRPGRDRPATSAPLCHRAACP
jgi:SAM-dependent methyltransferase